MPGNIFDFLSPIFVVHPFKGDANALWMAFNRSFFWSLWHERNEWYFNDNSWSFEGLFDLVLSILYFGVKVHTPLEISLTALLNICISFLLLTFVGYSFHLSRKSLRFSSKKKKRKKLHFGVFNTGNVIFEHAFSNYETVSIR